MVPGEPTRRRSEVPSHDRRGSPYQTARSPVDCGPARGRPGKHEASCSRSWWSPPGSSQAVARCRMARRRTQPRRRLRPHRRRPPRPRALSGRTCRRRRRRSCNASRTSSARNSRPTPASGWAPFSSRASPGSSSCSSSGRRPTARRSSSARGTARAGQRLDRGHGPPPWRGDPPAVLPVRRQRLCRTASPRGFRSLPGPHSRGPERLPGVRNGFGRGRRRPVYAARTHRGTLRSPASGASRIRVRVRVLTDGGPAPTGSLRNEPRRSDRNRP